jgi:hypothetical protein
MDDRKEITYDNINQNRQFFLDSIVDFREKMGDRTFWEKPPEIRQISIDALTQDYLKTEHGENLQDDADVLMTTLDEYHTREIYITMHPIIEKH